LHVYTSLYIECIINPLTTDKTLPDMAMDFSQLTKNIRQWALELGFQQLGITDTDLAAYETHFNDWLAHGHQGEMDYMSAHGNKRISAQQLVPGTIRVISVRLDYLTQDINKCLAKLDMDDRAYISDYAIGRDYHKLVRKRLQKLSTRIEQQVGKFGYRVFCDSAPVLEKPLAEKSGLGWIGKHTNLINKDAGSWYFLGEIYTDLPLDIDAPAENHCGSCDACIQACPTDAIIGPYQLDARKCISYLTIELKGSIPEHLRPLLGNRIYGCDDCQLVCPWNRFAQLSVEDDFKARHQLDDISLLQCFSWTEAEFNQYTEGSAIRRIGYHQWLRNVAVALGNALAKNTAGTAETTRKVNENIKTITAALTEKSDHDSEIVREHVSWALNQLN